MKVVVIGAGDVGYNIARHLLEEKQDVVVIDNDPSRVAHISEVLDVQVVEGEGSHPDVLEAAGCDTADMLIAVTHADEVNMVACQIAYSLYNVPIKIARVRDQAYFGVTRNRLYHRDHVPIDAIINPEVEVANSILRTIMVPGAFDAEDFADGQLRVIGTIVQGDSPLLGKPLAVVYPTCGTSMKVLAIYRRDRLLIPHPEDHLEKDDVIYVISAREDTSACMDMLGFGGRVARRVFVLGGGNVGYSIAAGLERVGLPPRLLGIDRERAEILADSLVETTVLHGDALDSEILTQEGVENMDMVVAVTQDDATNILASTLVRQLGCQNVITLVNKSSFVPLVQSLGLEKVISPGETTVSRILKYLRGRHVQALHTVRGGKAEIFEATATETSRLVGAHMRDLELPEGVQVGALVHEGRAFIPGPHDIVHQGDRVVFAELAHDVQGGVEIAVDGIVAKPFHIQTLKNEVQRLLPLSPQAA